MEALILIDSCVLIDVIEGGNCWAEWSARQLKRLQSAHTLAIDVVIYAEIAKSFASRERLDACVTELDLRMLDVSRCAGWHASQARLTCRRNRGSMSLTLPDFFTGAQAQWKTARSSRGITDDSQTISPTCA